MGASAPIDAPITSLASGFCASHANIHTSWAKVSSACGLWQAGRVSICRVRISTQAPVGSTQVQFDAYVSGYYRRGGHSFFWWCNHRPVRVDGCPTMPCLAPFSRRSPRTHPRWRALRALRRNRPRPRKKPPRRSRACGRSGRRLLASGGSTGRQTR